MRTKSTLEHRFWRNVDRRGVDECWPWTGYTEHGYGRISSGKKNIQAHRLSWRIHFGPIPPGMCVLHRHDVETA